MLNSLTVFFAFTAFLIFGYLSLLRLLSKQHLNQDTKVKFISKLADASLFRNLGSSALFVSLPATALLLFWGWGPALIWLLIFHIFVESVFHLQFSAQTTDSSIADHLLRAEHGVKGNLEQGLIQAFFLLSMSVVVALVATLLDRQPGLLFALLFLLPARALISHPSTALPKFIKIVGALMLLALGLAFSDQLGFSVYGDWAPFGQLIPWLVFNMPTLIAAIIVVSVFRLETNQGFRNDLSLFAGIIIVLLVAAMLLKLIWLQPILDAPMNSAQFSKESLPSFALLSLFIFAGCAAFLIRLLNSEEHTQDKARIQFSQLQTISLVQNFFIALLILSLATATGIGAWKTHFIEWSTELNILDYLNLAISSALNLIYADASSGALLHTILLAALCFTGFSFLLMCADQLTLEESEKETILSMVIEAKLPQAIGIFVLSAYFIGNGISVNVWLFTGILAWVLFTHLVIGMCLDRANGLFFAAVTLAVIGLGVVQLLGLIIYWLTQGSYLLLTLSAAVLGLTAFLWAKDIKPLWKKLSRNETPSIL